MDPRKFVSNTGGQGIVPPHQHLFKPIQGAGDKYPAQGNLKN